MATNPGITSWAKGALSPQIRGRVNIDQYQQSAEELTNVLVRPYTNVINRPGSEFIVGAKHDDKDTRWLEFVFSQTDAYMIEFGDQYMRFFTDSGQVIKASPASWVTSTAYVVGDFVEESGTTYYCIVTHTSGTFATDLAANKWVAQSAYEIPTPYLESEIRRVQYVQSKDVIFMVHPDHPPRKLTRLAADNWTLTEIDFLGGPFLDGNVITADKLDPTATTGSITVMATGGHTPFLPGHVGSYWSINGTVGTPPDDIQGYVIMTGYVSSTEMTADVIETLSGAGGTKNWAEGAWSEVRGYPGAVTFDKRRLAFAGTVTEPQKLWESKPFIFDDFTVGDEDDKAINIEISSDQSNSIHWLSPGTVLAVGTFGGEFVVSSGTVGNTLTPDNVNAQPQSAWGSEIIQPRRITHYSYYVQRFGRKLRELFYYFDEDIYKSVDVTIYSEHITESGIIELAYQRNPDSTLWCVLNNGKIATFTREIDQLIQAWTLQETDGLYKSIGTIPSNDEEHDEVWVIVDRVIDGVTKKYIERFKSQTIPDEQQDCFYVDSGLTFDAYELTDGITLTLSATTGDDVSIVASASYFDATMEGRRIKAYKDGVILGDILIKDFVSDTVMKGDIRFDFTDTVYAGGLWGVSVTTLTGLDHLEGKEIVYLADGGVENFDDRLTVASGSVEMNDDYFHVNIGLPYEAFVVTNPIEFGSRTGTAQGQLKRINQIGAKFYRSLGVEYGYDKTELFKFENRSDAQDMGVVDPLFTGDYTARLFEGRADYTGQITIAQRRALPMNLLSILPIMMTHNK